MIHKIHSYLQYLFKRKRWAHSVFIYDFIVSVLRCKNNKTDFVEIEKKDRKSRQNRRKDHLLYNIIKHYQCENIVLINSKTEYYGDFISLATGGNEKVYTIENPIEISKITPKVIDMFFINGNYSDKLLMEYFNAAKSHIKDSSIILLENIHLSAEMEQAWEKIKADADVSITIDLYCICIVFFRKGIVKQDFIL